MRAVNLLPPDLRSGPKGPAPAVPAGVENSGAGAFVVLGVLAFAVLALAAYVLAGNTVKDREAELAAATAKSAAVTQQVDAAEALRRLRVGRQRPRPDRQATSPTRASTGSRRCATSPAPSRPTSRSPRFKGDLGAAERRRRRRQHPRRDHRPGDHAHGLHLHADQGRRADGPPAQHRRRHPRLAREVRQGGHRRRRRPPTARAPTATGYCGKADVPAFELVVFFEGAAAASTAPTPGAAAAATGDDHGTTPAAGATPAATPAAGATPGARRRGTRRHPGACRHDHARLDHPLDTVTKNKTLLIAVVAAAAATRRLLVPRPRAQARGGGEPRRPRSPPSRPSSSTAQQTLAGYQQVQGRLRQATTRPWSGSARPCRRTTTSARCSCSSTPQAGGTRRRLPHDPGRRQRRRRRRRADAAGAAARPPPPGAVSVGSAGFSAMPFTFSFRGTLRQPVAASSPGWSAS